MSTASTLTERIEPARERLEVAAGQARERARERARVGAEVARERAGEARERAAEVAERMEPTAGRMADMAGTAAKRGLGAVALLPDLLSRLLDVLSHLLSGLADQGREVAARVEPPTHVRRRRAFKTAGWFGAGFLAGAVAGWIAHARSQREAQPPYGHVDVDGDQLAAYGDDAATIDARTTQDGMPRRDAPVA